MKGYKVFDSDWTCRGVQYEVGKTYEMECSPIPRLRGFHFCEKASDCFSYYAFNSNNKVAEVDAIGKVLTDGDKSVTNKIVILRELPWLEVLSIVNTGKDNTGRSNTGDSNTGDGNTGDYNTGGCNTGDYNTGGCNTGDGNTGDYNTGDCNTGDYNTGDYNTGWFNYSNNNTGFFNTEENNVLIFDKPSKYTRQEFMRTEGCKILSCMPFGAYFKDGVLTEHTPEDRQAFWSDLSGEIKKVVLSIENFDAEKFKLCTGIDVNIK